MKKSLLIILAIAFTISSCCIFNNIATKNIVQSSATVYAKSTVVIDPGHGGRDVGAVGIDGSLESVINLGIGLKLFDILMASGIYTIMTRYGDYQTYYDENANKNKSDLYYRLDLVNETENSVLVSIHQNHFNNENEWGTQVWYAPNSQKSKQIADNVLTSIITNLQPHNKRVNKVSDKSYYILYNAIQPSIMVECGFISNSVENAKLQNDEYQCDMAFSIFCGLYGEL